MIEDWWTIVLIAKTLSAWGSYLLAGGVALLGAQTFAMRWYRCDKPLRCFVLDENTRSMLIFIVFLAAGICLMNEMPSTT